MVIGSKTYLYFWAIIPFLIVLGFVFDESFIIPLLF